MQHAESLLVVLPFTPGRSKPGGRTVVGVIEEISAQDYAIRAVRVISADALWTRTLQGSELSVAEIGELAYMARSEILEGWLHVADSEVVKPLQDVINTHIEEVKARVSTILPQGTERQDTDQRLATPEAFLQALTEAFSDLMESRHREAEILTAKIKNIESGNWVPGDLTPPSLCNLIFAASAAAAITGDFPMGSYLLALWTMMGCAAETAS
ncbi:hypothetical protein ACH4M4_05965 [Streptomyces sp. NPDC017254]|uniref:hypothetical protein n=1 Tax=unclassified Streptomyces TaxID=2593676 RepID=UPI0037A9C359